eukprot:9194677-Ditylum_brightwellii.AAC.1
MVRLGQYPFGIMEVKRYVLPFLKYGKTKIPTQAVPKGTVRAGTSVDSKLSMWSFMDSSLVYILDLIHGEKIENYSRINKETGVCDTTGQCQAALNTFNNEMYAVDCLDEIRAAKHGRYSIEMYGHQYKWMVRFGDGLVDMLQSNGFPVYCSIHSTVKAVRWRGQSKYMLDALATGSPLMSTDLKKKKDVAVEDETLLAYSEGVQNLTSIQEYHHSYKSDGWIRNDNRTNLCKQLHRLSSKDAQ